jgi:ribosomal protein S18 acetylase RimI-like enzyme
VLLVAIDGRVCGVCGLNVDPLAGSERVGRVRRLYVSAAVRRRGVGSAMMRQLMHDAARRFDELRLRTHDPRAAAFYEAIGFTPVGDSQQCTYRLKTAVGSVGYNTGENHSVVNRC